MRDDRDRDRRGHAARLLGGFVASFAAAAPAQAAGGLHLWPPDWATFGLLLLAFLVMLVPMNALIFKPLFAAMDAREDRIAGARRRGEKLETDAAEVLERYQTAVRGARDEAEQDRRTRIEEARAERGSITDAARGEAEAEVERSRGDIQRSLDEARSSLRESGEALAREAAERILGRSLS